MPTTESIEPNCRGLAVTCGQTGVHATRISKQKKWRSLVIYIGMLCSLTLFLNGRAHHDACPPSKSAISAPHAELTGGTAAYSPQVTVFRAKNAKALVNKLKENHLWKIKAGSAVTPLLLASYPPDLDTLSTREKKKAFLNSLLPAALMTNAEISKERQTLLSIIDKIPLPVSTLTFSADQKNWQQYVNKDEIDFLLGLTRKYRTSQAEKLLMRVNIIPVSLILAQGALESSWGTSRFTREGNNLFGIWTWRKDGIVPNDRDEGKSHKVEAYDSILASLQKYTLTLNRLDAYADFRKIRAKNLNPYALADGLKPYSELGADYVSEIKEVIASNNLTRFDEVQFPDIAVTMLPVAGSQTPADTIAQL